LSRFDLEKTIDSEGDMLRGGLVNPAQVKSAADAYERGERGDRGERGERGDREERGEKGEGDKPDPSDRSLGLDAKGMKSPPPKVRLAHPAATASPASRGSSFTNSGLFDNLTDNDIEQEGRMNRSRDVNASNSLALSDSAGVFDDDNDTKL
jgi:hypothetical protein